MYEIIFIIIGILLIIFGIFNIRNSRKAFQEIKKTSQQRIHISSSNIFKNYRLGWVSILLGIIIIFAFLIIFIVQNF